MSQHSVSELLMNIMRTATFEDILEYDVSDIIPDTSLIEEYVSARMSEDDSLMSVAGFNELRKHLEQYYLEIDRSNIDQVVEVFIAAKMLKLIASHIANFSVKNIPI